MMENDQEKELHQETTQQIKEFTLRFAGNNDITLPDGSTGRVGYFTIHQISDDPEQHGLQLVEQVGEQQIPIVMTSTPIIVSPAQQKLITPKNNGLKIIH